MKRVLTLFLIAALTVGCLSGCSRKSAGKGGGEPTPTPNDGGLAELFAEDSAGDSLPDAYDTPVDATENPLPYTIVDQSSYAVTDDEATETEDEQPEGAEAGGDEDAQPAATSAAVNLYQTSAYSLATLSDTSFGFTFSYPTKWKNLPGKSTVCFEADDGSEFPARVAVTRKTLVHTPTDETIFKQFQSYAQMVYAQYDPETFEFSSVNNMAVFMNHNAYEVSYMAYKGDVEVQGYIICCAIEKALYVFHFRASYDDYRTLNPVMVRMRESVALVGGEEEEQ